MKILYFDTCAIPIYLLILWTCYIRKMTRGHANRIFILLNWMSLCCAICDIAMELLVNPLPLSQLSVILGTLLSFTYKLVRNAEMVVILIFVFAITRTEYLIRPLGRRLLLWLPYGVLVVLLLQNFFTHNVFVVTAENGYARGELLIVFYIVAGIYGLIGTAYTCYCKRYLAIGKWIALLSIYVLTFVGVTIQLFRSDLLVELFSSSIGSSMILLLVMRPEESMDAGVGIQNWKTYKTDLANIVKRHESMQILVIRIVNAEEIRSYLGEDRYNGLLLEVVDEMQKLYKENRSYVNGESYLERPGTLYLTLDDAEYDLEVEVPPFLERCRVIFNRYADCSIRFDVKTCLIRYPDDLTEVKEILNLGQKFPQFGELGQEIFRASDIVKSRDYEIVSHMDEILRRAIDEDGFEMYYQPIYNNRTGCFASAEALLRLKDSKYGMISPGIFIPYAEANGFILPIGDIVLDKVFRFISAHDLEDLGLGYIEINLSVAQVLQRDLPEKVAALQERYRVKPAQVNFEITETLYDNISDVMDRNVRKLKEMGYSFSLDDYGVGYSNIQRMSKLPLSIIKIDKSLVDEMFTEDGRVIIKNTVRMVQGIHKELVVEGVETREEIEALAAMSCEYIQGFYYSKPLPEREFVRFLMENKVA